MAIAYREVEDAVVNELDALLNKPKAKRSVGDVTFKEPSPDDIAELEKATAASPDPSILPRRSNMLRQGAAGVTDIITGLPMLAGFVGSGLETLAKYPSSDKGFVDLYKESLEEGVDKDLLMAGMRGRQNVNEALGIEEAYSTEDQIARLIGSFLVPVPAGFLGGVAATGLKGALGKASTFVLPAVRMGEKGNRFNKTFGLRAGTSLGLGTGIDQTIRGVMDHPEIPMMLSREALAGGPGRAKGASDFDEAVAELVAIEEADPPAMDITAEGDRRKALQELDERYEREKNFQDWQSIALGIGAVLVGGAGLRHLYKGYTKSLGGHAPMGLNEPAPGPWPTGFKGKVEHFQETQIDANKAVIHTLRDDGFPDEIIQDVVVTGRSDPVVIQASVAETGRFKQGTNIKVPSLRSLEQKAMALQGKKFVHRGVEYEKLELFQRAYTIGDELNRLKSVVGTGVKAQKGLWRKGISNADLEQVYKAAASDPEIRALLKGYGEFFDGHLKYATKLGTLDAEGAAAMRLKFSNTDPNSPMSGSLGFAPFYAATPRRFAERLKNFFGVYSKKGEELDLLSVYFKRGMGTGEKPFDVIIAARLYNFHAIEHALNNSYWNQILNKLARVEINVQANGKTAVQRMAMDVDSRRLVPIGKEISKASDLEDAGRGTKLVGIGDVGDDLQTTRIKINGDEFDDHIETRYVVKAEDGTVQRELSISEIKARAARPEEIYVVQRQGTLRVYEVPSAEIRGALDMNPQLGPHARFHNHYKRLFTKGTVGEYSLFAPIAHIYAQQQAMLNQFAREGFVAGLRTFPDSIRGSYNILVTNWALEIGDHLAKRLGTNTGIGRFAPELTRKLSKRLGESFGKSLVTEVRGEMGKIGGNRATEVISQSMDEFMRKVGTDDAIKIIGPSNLGLAWRMWKGFVNAVHEGPAFGLIQRKVGQQLIKNKGKDLRPIELRRITVEAKELVGDMQKMGSSDMARTLNATIPFYTAMVQSWNAIGSAAIRNPARFLAGATTIIGVPTVAEMLWASVLGKTVNPETGKPWAFTHPDDPGGYEWTYDDYYHNGFTTEQKVSNFVYMLPGKPPWEAIVYPCSPEWSLFRGAVMSGLDAILNLSNVGSMAVANAGTGSIGRDHLFAGFLRVFDIPLPPTVAAAFSLTGTDIRMGLAIDKNLDDPDDPGSELSFFRSHPIGKGEQITKRSSTSKYLSGTVDTKVGAAINDIFGSAGALYVSVQEAFMSGLRLGGTEAGIKQATEMSFDALGDGALRQMRWMQPFFKSVGPSENNEIARELHLRRKNLGVMMSDARAFMGETLLDPKGNPDVRGVRLLTRDPIWQHILTQAQLLNKNITMFDKTLSQKRQEKNHSGNASVFPSIKARRDRLDLLSLEINELKAKQLAEFVKYENWVSDVLSKFFKRDITIDMSTIAPRPKPPGLAEITPLSILQKTQ